MGREHHRLALGLVHGAVLALHAPVGKEAPLKPYGKSRETGRSAGGTHRRSEDLRQRAGSTAHGIHQFEVERGFRQEQRCERKNPDRGAHANAFP